MTATVAAILYHRCKKKSPSIFAIKWKLLSSDVSDRCDHDRWERLMLYLDDQVGANAAIIWKAASGGMYVNGLSKIEGIRKWNTWIRQNKLREIIESK